MTIHIFTYNIKIKSGIIIAFRIYIPKFLYDEFDIVKKKKKNINHLRIKTVTVQKQLSI